MAGKEIKKFVYNEEAIDVAIFGIPVDRLHWKLLCEHAIEMNTTPEHIWAMILEAYLINISKLDPRAPKGSRYELPVTIRDLREEPDKLFNFRQNDLIWDGKKKEESTQGALKAPVEDDDDDDLGLVDFS